MPNGYLFPRTGKKMPNFDQSHSFDFAAPRRTKPSREHRFIGGVQEAVTGLTIS